MARGVIVISLTTSVLGAAGAMPETLKVGFIYVGPVGDYGWSYAHDQGRKYLETALPDVKTTYVESVSERADAERVLTQLARSGHKVIVGTSYGYMDTMLKVAERFPMSSSCTARAISAAPTWELTLRACIRPAT